jgi:hypothetical protein
MVGNYTEGLGSRDEPRSSRCCAKGFGIGYLGVFARLFADRILGSGIGTRSVVDDRYEPKKCLGVRCIDPVGYGADGLGWRGGLVGG